MDDVNINNFGYNPAGNVGVTMMSDKVEIKKGSK